MTRYQGPGFPLLAYICQHIVSRIIAFRNSRGSYLLLLNGEVAGLQVGDEVGGEIWGRGSVDAKGSVACQIVAVEELIKEGVIMEGDVAMLYVLGEGKFFVYSRSLNFFWSQFISN